jgi:hypothetical protein
MGWLERRERELGQDLLYLDNNPQRPNLSRPRPNASHPVILPSDAYDLWLDPGLNDVQVVSELLKPYDANAMRSYPVSMRVNRVENDDQECAQRVVISEAQNRLFI